MTPQNQLISKSAETETTSGSMLAAWGWSLADHEQIFK